MKSECFKIRGPCDGKQKTNLGVVCQVTLSSSQICKEVQKPCCERDDYLFWMDAQYIYFFQLPKPKKHCLEAELVPTHHVIKSSKWVTCGSTRCMYSLSLIHI